MHVGLQATACSKDLFTAGVVHCSLNPDNVVLIASQSQMCVRVTGFEASQTCGSTDCLSRHIPPTPFTAPEVQNGRYNAAVDLWSVGGIVYWLLSGHLPGRLDSGKLYCHQTLCWSSMWFALIIIGASAPLGIGKYT